MANPFEQFDPSPAPPSDNPFAQFDQPAAEPFAQFDAPAATTVAEPPAAPVGPDPNARAPVTRAPVPTTAVLAQGGQSAITNLFARGAASEGALPAAQGVVGGTARALSGDEERFARIEREAAEMGFEDTAWGRGVMRFGRAIRDTSRNIQEFLLGSEKNLAEAREFVREALPVDDELLASKAGQIILGLGQAGGTLSIWLTPYVGQIAGPMASAGQIYQEGFDDAVTTLEQRRAAGEVDLTDEQVQAMAHDAGVKNLPAAALDALGDRLIVGRLLKPFKGKITVGRLLKEITGKSLVEGGTEGAQQAWLNAVAESLAGYDPERTLDQGVIDSIIVGFVVGGISSGAIDTAQAAQQNREQKLAALQALEQTSREAQQVATATARIGEPEIAAAENEELSTQDSIVDAQNQIIDQAREAQAAYKSVQENAAAAQQALELAQNEEQAVQEAIAPEIPEAVQALETIAELGNTTAEQVENEIALDVVDPYSQVLTKYPEFAQRVEADPKLQARLPVEIRREDGSIVPALFNGYYEWIGGEMIPAIGYLTAKGTSDGMLRRGEQLLTTVPTPQQWEAGVRTFAEIEEQAAAQQEVPRAEEAREEVAEAGAQAPEAGQVVEEGAGGVRLRDDAQAGLEAGPGEVVAAEPAPAAETETELPPNTLITVQRSLGEGDRGWVQVDLFDEQGNNTESTTPAELAARGIIPPFIPADIPAGQHTLAELEQMSIARMLRGETVEELDVDEQGLIREPGEAEAEAAQPQVTPEAQERLVEVNGRRWFRGANDRPVVIMRVGNGVLPFYRSMSGTSGKQRGRWYAYGGHGRRGWFIKGGLDDIEGSYGSPEIAEAERFLNEQFTWPRELDENLGEGWQTSPLSLLGEPGDIGDINQAVFGTPELQTNYFPSAQADSGAALIQGIASTAQRLPEQMQAQRQEEPVRAMAREVEQPVVRGPRVPMPEEEVRESRKRAQRPENREEAKQRRLARIGLPANGEPDLINVLQDLGGVPAPKRGNVGAEYDRFRDVFGKGAALLLVNSEKPGSKYGAGGIDTILQQLEPIGYRFDSMDQFYDAVERALATRETLAQAEAQALKIQRLEESFFANQKNRQRSVALQSINIDELAVGDSFRINGEKFTVIDIDEEGNVVIKDGLRYEIAPGVEVYPDRGSWKPVKREIDFVEGLEPEPEPEEVQPRVQPTPEPEAQPQAVPAPSLELVAGTEAELAAEQAGIQEQQQRQAQREAMLERAEAPLAGGPQIPLEQGEMFMEGESLFGGPSLERQAQTQAPAGERADYSITRTGDNFFIEATLDGERIGFARFQVRDDRAFPLYVEVDEAFRRQGVATEMYRRFAEEYPLLPISEAATQLPEGRAFRQALRERGVLQPSLELAAEAEGLPALGEENLLRPEEIQEEREQVPADQPQAVIPQEPVGAMPAEEIAAFQEETGEPAPVSVPPTQFQPAGSVPNMDPAAGGRANLEAAEMEGLQTLLDIPETAGPARRIITRVFGEKFGVLGKRQLTPDERFRARQRANQLFNQARLPAIWDAQNEVYRLANPNFPAEEEGRRLVELLREEFARGVGPNDALLSVVVNSIRNPDGGFWTNQAFSQGLRNQMFALAQGEASFYGLMLGALSRAKRTLSFVAQNVDVVLHKSYSQAFGGDGIQGVLDRTRKETGDELSDEIEKKIRKRRRKPRKPEDRDTPEEVPDDFDGEEAVEEINENQRSANTLVEQFARIQSDTPDLQENRNINEVRQRFFQQVVNPGERQMFIDDMLALEVDQRTAEILFSIAGRETSARRIARDIREIDRPAREATSILERFARIQSDTPSLRQNQNPSKVRALFAEQVANPSSLETFVASMEAAGVEPAVARNLFNVAATERRNRAITREIRDQLRTPAATRTAEAEIARLARIHSDVQAWTPAQNNQVAEAIRQQKKNPQDDARFVEIVEGLGVSADVARTLANAVRMEIDARARIAELNLERRVASPRAEREAPAPGRTSGIRPLIDRILFAPPSQQNDPAWRRRVALEFFVDNGLTAAQAQEAQQLFDSEWQALLGQTKKRAFARVRDSLTKSEQRAFRTASPGRKLWERIEEAVNSGAFDNSEVLENLAKDNKWRVPTPEEREQLKALADREQSLRMLTEQERAVIGDNPSAIQRATMEKAAVTRQARYALRRQMQTLWSRFSRPINITTPEGRRNFGAAAAEFLSANMLLKLGFATKQIVDVGTQFVYHIPTRVAGHALQRHLNRGSRGTAAEFMRDLSTTLGQSMADVARASGDAVTQLRQGLLNRGELRNVEGLVSTINAFDRLRLRADELDANGQHAKAFAVRLVALPQFAYRWARALDNMQGTFTEALETRQRLITELEENGRTPEEARREAQQILADRNAEQHLALARAKEMLEELGIEATPLEIKAAAYEIFKARQFARMEAAGLDGQQIAQDNEILRNTVGWNQPETTTASIGALVGGPVATLGRLSERVGVPLAIGRFGNAIAISINRALTWTPVGFFPGAFGGEANFWFRTPADRAQRKAEAAAGTAIGGALIAAALGGLIRVWNKAPDDPEERELWEKQGHRAGTVEINVGDGRFIPLSTSSGPMSFARPWLGGIGEVQDAQARRQKRQESFERRAARRGGVVESIPDLTAKDIYAAAGWGGIQAAFGGRTAGGAVRSFTKEDTRAPDLTMFVSSQVSPFFPGLPAYQEIQRALGTRIDPRFADVTDLMFPTQGNMAARQNFLSDDLTRTKTQNIVQTLTGGSFPGVVDEATAREMTPYRILSRIPYRPGALSRNEGFLIDGVVRPLTDEEFIKVTRLRGSFLKQALIGMDESLDDDTLNIAVQRAANEARREALAVGAGANALTYQEVREVDRATEALSTQAAELYGKVRNLPNDQWLRVINEEISAGRVPLRDGQPDPLFVQEFNRYVSGASAP